MEKRILNLLILLLAAFVRSGTARILCKGYPEDLNPDHKNGTIECNTNACVALWHTTTHPNNETTHKAIKKGCWQNEEKKELRNCHEECIQQPIPEAMKKKNVSGYCCCTTALCNANFTLKEYPPENVTDTAPSVIDPEVGGFSSATVAIVVFCVLFLVLAIIGAVVLWMLNLKKKPRYMPTGIIEKEPLGPSMDLGKLTREYLIGQGRYGTVWKGRLNGENVAVKVFHPGHRQYWLSEKQLFASGYTHTNILKFIAAEENHLDDGPEYLLVTEYHPRGSLLDFLKSNTVTWREMCMLSQTAAAGLAFLHQDGEEDFVGGNKLSYVHRDFNSRNLLVKTDKTCVLADFGFAMQVSGLGTAKTDDGPFVAEVGTLRYMAPEVLDGAVNLHDLQSALKQIDVYALALVTWEIAMRCTDLFGKEPVPEYKPPYERELGPVEPENLHVYVVQNKSRPLFPDAWKHNHVGLRSLKEAIEDCWDQDADARLTALCMQERISELANHYPDGLAPSSSHNMVQPFQQNFKGNPLSNLSTSQGNVQSLSDMIVVNLSDTGKRRSTEVTTV